MLDETLKDRTLSNEDLMGHPYDFNGDLRETILNIPEMDLKVMADPDTLLPFSLEVSLQLKFDFTASIKEATGMKDEIYIALLKAIKNSSNYNEKVTLSNLSVKI